MKRADFLAGSEAEVLKILKEDYTESELVGVIIYPTRYENDEPNHAITYQTDKDSRAFRVDWIERSQRYKIAVEKDGIVKVRPSSK